MISRALRKCFSVNPLRSVVRSENQNITWSLEDLERHSDAFSAGIQELGLSKGNKKLDLKVKKRRQTLDLVRRQTRY